MKSLLTDSTCVLLALTVYLIHLSRRLYETMLVSIFSRRQLLSPLDLFWGFSLYLTGALAIIADGPDLTVQDREYIFRPPLKKILFPVQRPGVYITAEWDFFFFILPKKYFLGQNFIIFLPPPPQKKKEKKKDFAAARLATISATRWTGNKVFFKGGLRVPTQVLQSLIKSYI